MCDSLSIPFYDITLRRRKTATAKIVILIKLTIEPYVPITISKIREMLTIFSIVTLALQIKVKTKSKKLTIQIIASITLFTRSSRFFFVNDS